jgi:hypothetical protein
MQHPTSLDVSDFRHLVERLCAAAADENTAAQRRLERLRRHGPDAVDGHDADRGAGR